MNIEHGHKDGNLQAFVSVVFIFVHFFNGNNKSVSRGYYRRMILCYLSVRFPEKENNQKEQQKRYSRDCPYK